jgi:hypothetical protein
MRITDEIEQEWIVALRSGEYTQCTGTLSRRRLDGGGFDHCCLGVLGAVMEAKGLLPKGTMESNTSGDLDYNSPYYAVEETYGDDHHLVDWNDDDRLPFSVIADRIEKKQTGVRHPN